MWITVLYGIAYMFIGAILCRAVTRADISGLIFYLWFVAGWPLVIAAGTFVAVPWCAIRFVDYVLSVVRNVITRRNPTVAPDLLDVWEQDIVALRRDVTGAGEQPSQSNKDTIC